MLELTLQIPNGGSGGTTPAATTGSNGNASSFNHQTLYTAGQCTWYVFDRCVKAGSPISTYWSDAKYSGSVNAANDGYQVNNTPSVGSITQKHTWSIWSCCLC